MVQEDRHARRRPVRTGYAARLGKGDLRAAGPRNKPGAGSGETKTLFAKIAGVPFVHAFLRCGGPL